MSCGAPVTDAWPRISASYLDHTMSDGWSLRLYDDAADYCASDSSSDSDPDDPMTSVGSDSDYELDGADFADSFSDSETPGVDNSECPSSPDIHLLHHSYQETRTLLSNGQRICGYSGLRA